MMKRTYLYNGLLIGALAMLMITEGYSQKKAFEPVSANEKAKLRAAVEANPNDLEAHKAYLAAFASADEAKSQYEQWMKKYPKSAAVPQALAEKYGSYSPQAAQYLLKAVELQPKNVELWQSLSTDAAFRGDRSKQIEYTEKAMVADPNNIGLQSTYVRLFGDDKVLYKQKVAEFVKKYPKNAETISLLHLYGYDLKDKGEKIAAWEQLRSMFFQSQNTPFQVAMTRLADTYIQTGQYEKAVELCAAMVTSKAPAHLNFAQKLELGKTLLAIENKMKEGNYAEAKAMALPLAVRYRGLFEVGSRVALLKAATLDATGSTQAAYDSLIIFQAKTPYKDVKEVLEQYASKLGKNKDQVKKEVRAEIARNSKPAAAFELDMYTSDKKMKLEDQKGKVVFLSFWYPGCGPCRGEMPHIETGIKNIDKSKLAYLGVNGVRDQDDFVVPFMKSSKFSFTPLGATGTITEDYGVRAYPSNFIIDQQGRIAYSGFMINADSEEMLELMIESLL